ncbi:MAG: TIGR03936 family radical SAM-associated protein [Candidatus Omnitrophica bacterium]|nr:TIGR03936 family radical SAM-associated protein [Candidatus Omnitrophota bacterium]
MFKVELVFSKQDRMRYLSHLDLMRLFTRAIRRAGLPVKMTEGFNPHPKFSMSRALKLGVESASEKATLIFREKMCAGEIKARLNGQLPKGIEVKDVQGYFN